MNAFVEENCPTLVESIRVPSDNVNDNEPVVPGGELKREFICSLTDSNQGYNFELECRKTGKEKKNDFASLDSCAEKMSGLNLKDSVDTDAKGDEDLFQLKKSGCVSSVASIFQNVEGKSKIVAEEEKIKKMPKGVNFYSFSKKKITRDKKFINF